MLYKFRRSWISSNKLKYKNKLNNKKLKLIYQLLKIKEVSKHKIFKIYKINKCRNYKIWLNYNIKEFRLIKKEYNYKIKKYKK